MLKLIKQKWNSWLLNRLVRYSGVWLTPEPGVWGKLSSKDEDEILLQIYENDQIVMLLKKYAEQANKEVLSSLSQVALGKFLILNGILLKAKRSWNNRDNNLKK